MWYHKKSTHDLKVLAKQDVYSWFQTFAVIWILYIFFWVFPRRQIVVGRRFGNLYQFHLQRLGVQCTVHPAFEDGTDTGFRNVGQLQFDAGEIPRRKYTRCILMTVYKSAVIWTVMARYIENWGGQVFWDVLLCQVNSYWHVEGLCPPNRQEFFTPWHISTSQKTWISTVVILVNVVWGLKGNYVYWI